MRRELQLRYPVKTLLFWTLFIPPVELFGCYFDSEIRTAQFALHAFDTCFKVFDRSIESLHFKNFGGAELNTNVTPLAVLLDNLNCWQFFFHLRKTPLFRNKRW